jgi:Ca-activated chloride channel homolog
LNFDHFRFSSPEYLLALVSVPVLFAFVAAIRRRRSRTRVLFTNLDAFDHVHATTRGRWSRRTPLVLLALTLAFLAFALARPTIELGRTSQGATIVLLVDVSSSMAASDVYPNRINAAVKAMRAFLKALPRGDKVGLVTFSDQPAIVAAPTSDRSVVESGLSALSPVGGTALGDGVQAAVNLAVTSLAVDGAHREPDGYLPAAIVLESDGAQNRGTVSTNQAAEFARDAGIKIYGVALGTLNGYITQGKGFSRFRVEVPPDRATVALLSRETGGQAFDAGSASSLDAIYRHLGSAIEKEPDAVEITSWFDFAAATLLVLAVVLGLAQGPALP